MRSAVFRPDSEKSGSARPCIGRGSVKRRGVAAHRLALDLRPARIAEAEQLRGLVEGFADGVVDAWCRAGRSRRRRAPRRSGCGRRRRGTGNRETPAPQVSRARQRMGFEMVDRRSAACRCTSAIALAVVSPTITPPIRPGPAAAATPSMLGKVDAGLHHRLGDDAVERLDMGARGDLRHHAAEGACSLICDSTMLDRILPCPSPRRSTTAAAVSSQVVSIPSTSIEVS